MTARCIDCNQPFRTIPEIGERVDDTALRIRAEFDAHNRNEDASQAAARIVTEATEDR